MKEIIIIILVFSALAESKSQSVPALSPKEQFNELARVVKLSDEQKDVIFPIYLGFSTTLDSLNQIHFETVRDYHKQRMEHYSLMKSKVYSLLTEKQVKAYEKYRLERRNQFKEQRTRNTK